ncbi:hypothetical protein V1477_002338 [Vespula maculifrons]|uniref:Uncharacterized protein n=1 Tax=Vespula maculifrons TaxID=7453 RepID=A0ABD2CW72_VESMC
MAESNKNWKIWSPVYGRPNPTHCSSGDEECRGRDGPYNDNDDNDEDDNDEDDDDDVADTTDVGTGRRAKELLLTLVDPASISSVKSMLVLHWLKFVNTPRHDKNPQFHVYQQRRR